MWESVQRICANIALLYRRDLFLDSGSCGGRGDILVVVLKQTYPRYQVPSLHFLTVQTKIPNI